MRSSQNGRNNGRIRNRRTNRKKLSSTTRKNMKHRRLRKTKQKTRMQVGGAEPEAEDDVDFREVVPMRSQTMQKTIRN